MSATEAPDAYPAGLEAAWLALGESAAGARGEEALDRLRPAVARLSDLFTVGRPAAGFPDYLADPALLAAYGLFFFPQSWTRTGWAMAHASFRGWRPARPAPRVLDLGSGPGSCGLRAARWLSAGGSAPGELSLVDRSAAGLAAAEAAAPAAAPGWSVAARVGDARDPAGWPEGGFDLIVAGFVLNELGLDDAGLDAWLESTAARLAPGGLLILIEPALRATAEPLRRLSDRRAGRPPRRLGTLQKRTRTDSTYDWREDGEQVNCYASLSTSIRSFAHCYCIVRPGSSPLPNRYTPYRRCCTIT